MIRPPAKERIVACRLARATPMLLGILVTGAAGLIAYAGLELVILGRVPLQGFAVFVAAYVAVIAAGQLCLRRLLGYCLTERRLILGSGHEIPLDQIARFDIGPHCLIIEDHDHRRHRIRALMRPAWLATRLNRCRAGGAPDTGICAT